MNLLLITATVFGQGGSTMAPPNSQWGLQPNTNSGTISPRKSQSPEQRPASSTGVFSPWKLLGGLAITIAVLIGALKYLQTAGPFGGIRGLPNDVFDIIGVKSLTSRHSIYLTRVGGKVLVLASTAENLTVLSEITDPIEIANLGKTSPSDSESSQPQESFLGRFMNHFQDSGHAEDVNSPATDRARHDLEARLHSLSQS